MPGLYNDGEYDLAGFIVGAVEKKRMITGASIAPGDVLLGLPSTGLHTNGYSLARKLLFEVAGHDVNTPVAGTGHLRRQGIVEAASQLSDSLFALCTIKKS